MAADAAVAWLVGLEAAFGVAVGIVEGDATGRVSVEAGPVVEAGAQPIAIKARASPRTIKSRVRNMFTPR